MLSRPRIAVLCSQRAPGLAHLIARGQAPDARSDIVCCLTSDEHCVDAPLVQSRNIPLLIHSRRTFYATHFPGRRLGDPAARRAYDQHTAAMLSAYRPDLVVLAGYLLLLTDPMLSAYAGRLINVHHSDLLLRDRQGRPKYPGLRAVRDAIHAGEIETRCSAHLVTASVDDGPVLARSEPFPVAAVAHWARAAGDREVLRSAIWAHQEWMLREAFGPLMVKAIELVAASPADFLECA